MNAVEKAQNEVDNNYKFFQTKLEELKNDHLNEFALLYKKEIIDFYFNEDDAIKIGIDKYGEGNFSIQQVNDGIIELGYQSYVII